MNFCIQKAKDIFLGAIRKYVSTIHCGNVTILAVTPDNSSKAILIYNNADNKHQLRFYSENKENFVDVDIRHSDLQVIIPDDEEYAIYFNKNKETYYIDHHPNTLGYKELELEQE